MTLPLILIGYGDIARRVAERHPDHPIITLARRPARAPAGHRASWQSLVCDLDRDTIPVQSLPEAALWLYFAPPPAQGLEDSRLQRWLTEAGQGGTPRQLIYASTTAVYGDVGGAWVDEHSPAAPQHDRGRRRLDAEQRSQRFGAARGVPLAILRITGIYACDRLPLDKIRAGTAIVCPEDAPWSNRIHAEDLAEIYGRLIARAEQGAPVTGVFNVSDGDPQPMSMLYLRTAAHFGLAPPPCRPLAEVLASASPMSREFLSESKRVRAQAIRQALDWQPRYPNLEAALKDCPPDPSGSGAAPNRR
ncbi:SDR family NAD(P)-dependent oxidoreductase [Halothiobacillus sp. DCM-1]|uniref:SDR family NAD(P)-dependent oxidoreductase n=1 Tax=Halothiobacillus sp. DCM-1 TaxID=3112558 RepID=UPI0032460091